MKTMSFFLKIKFDKKRKWDEPFRKVNDVLEVVGVADSNNNKKQDDEKTVKNLKKGLESDTTRGRRVKTVKNEEYF